MMTNREIPISPLLRILQLLSLNREDRNLELQSVHSRAIEAKSEEVEGIKKPFFQIDAL